MTIVGNDMSSIYRDMCRDLGRYGQRVCVRDQQTVELTDVHVQLYNPMLRFVNFRVREVSMRYLVGELCYYLDARTDLASMAYYSKFWEKVSDDGLTINSAYGARIFGTPKPPQHGPWPETSFPNQFKYAIHCLEADHASRKAVMMIYHPSDARESRDNPCTLSLQLLIRCNELSMYTNMRSQDVWLGVPYDYAFFTIVQEIAYMLLRKTYPRLKLGTYFHSTTSLHAYKENFKAIDVLSTERDHVLVHSPPIVDMDVDNWFDDLLTYEKSKRGVVAYRGDSHRTLFQDWCKQWLD